MKKFYITTAIDYVNGPPHLGHAVQKIWADIIARYHRLKGDDVFFLTGTDEHGLSVMRAAERQGKTPAELAEENSAKFRAFKETLNLSWDDFIRTTDRERHWPGAIMMWHKLTEAGDIYLKKYKGLYCVGHEAFITPKDLADGVCVLHGTKPEEIEEENYFFKLSKYTKPIKKAIQSGELKILPETRRNEILSVLEEGLEDVSFSRQTHDVPWGIPVPDDPSHTMYVWCDALANYISALGYGTDDDSRLRKYWPADVHVLGKDNLRFHAAIWPGMLMSAGLPLPRSVFCHGFITVDGQKMSKTIGNVINPFKLVEQYGADVVRFFFSREISTYEDGDFSYKKLEDRYNGDLANNLGNLISRVAKLIETQLEGELNFKDQFVDKEVRQKIGEALGKYGQAMDVFKLHEAVEATWNLLTYANIYIDEKKPWADVEGHPDHFLTTITSLVELIMNAATMIQPIMPETSAQIFKTFGYIGTTGQMVSKELNGYKFVVIKFKPLFPRLK